jgi:hypothetical protein
MSPAARIGRVVLEDVTVERVGRVPAVLEGRPGQPIETILLRRVSLRAEGGGRAGRPGPPSPQVDPWDPLPFWGFVARHVRRLAIEDVRLSLGGTDQRPMALLDDVGTLTWAKAGVPPGGAGRVIAVSVGRVDAPGVDVRREPVVDARTSAPAAPTGPVAPPLVTFAGARASFAQDGDTVWVKAEGAGPLATSDEYGAVFRKAALGSGQRVSVRVTKTDPGTGVLREAMGVILRNDVASPRRAAGYVVLTAFASNGIAMQWDADGDGRLDGHSPMDGYSEWPCWLRIERRGTRFTGLSSTDGERWTTIGSVELPSAAPLQDAGVFVTRMAAAFDDLRIEPLP